MNKIFIKQKGFTLIEVILYIGIASVLFLSITTLFSALLQSRSKAETISEVEGTATQVMQLITQTIRNGIAINAPASGSSASTLSLNVVSGALNPTIFSLSSGNITMQEGANPVTVISSNLVNVSALNFKNLSNNSIEITFTLSRINPDGKSELNYTQTYYGGATIR